MKQIGDKQVLSVSEVNAAAQETLELLTFWVEGEISSIQTNPNWYYAYINLKDENSLLPCFLEPKLLLNSQEIVIGQKVLIYGMLTLFKKSEYKMRIFRLERTGEGVLQKQFEILYQKLKKEGLFGEKHKKTIPLYPKKVCLVTSKGSAGWNDFKTHTVDKFPTISLYSVNVQVEGAAAVKKLLKILPKIDNLGFDIIVITRGGGAQESLMEVFNNEALVRAIFKVKTPTVVAIGHEINISLTELVADKRASTPTDAASIVTQGYTHALEKLENLRYLLKSKSGYYFSTNFQRLDHAYLALGKSKIVFKDLPFRLSKTEESLKLHQRYLVENSNATLINLLGKLQEKAKQLTRANTQTLNNLYTRLVILSPKNTLRRGYSLTVDSKGKIIRSISPIVVGSDITVKLFDGSLFSTVKSKEKNV